MQWLLISCILLATAANVQSYPRPKRDLSYVKNMIASKLFGSETIVIQQPDIPKNETYQLFKIKGYNDILLKITRKPEKKKEKVKVVIERVQDPVIVSPEIAIIGNYLGTTTQSETLLILEIAKNLLKSGILTGQRDEAIEDVVKASQISSQDYITQEHVKPVKVFIGDREPIYVYPPVAGKVENMDIVNLNPVHFHQPNYQPIAITSELKYRPFQTMYSYKQMGEKADMTYESYNDEDVIVTRTLKEPPIPQFIKLRIVEVASIGANPYLIRPPQPMEAGLGEGHLVQPFNVVPGSYGYLNPPVAVQQNMQVVPIPTVMDRFSIATKSAPNFEAVEELGFIVPNNINRHSVLFERTPILSKPIIVPNFTQQSGRPHSITNHPIEPDHYHNTNQIYRTQKHHKNSENVQFPPKMPLLSNPELKEENPIKIIQNVSVEEPSNQKPKNMSENSDTNKQIVSKYLYKQMNQYSHDRYTVVNVEDPSKISKHVDATEANVADKTTAKLPSDFIFVPPENIDIPPPNMLPITSNMEISRETENYPKGTILNPFKDVESKPLPLDNKGILKTNDQHSLKTDPILVLENKTTQRPSRIYKGGRKRIRPYTGGPVF